MSEFNGIKLRLSVMNETGYEGVQRMVSGYWDGYMARRCVAGRLYYIGMFNSAEEAAEAYARSKMTGVTERVARERTEASSAFIV